MNQKNNKPKILIFSLAYSPFIGGAEIAVQEITKHLAGGFEFDLICARMSKKLLRKEKVGNVNVYRMGFGFKNLDKYIFTFFGFFKAIKLYKKNKYKIIWPIMAAYSSFAVLFKIFTKTKVVLTLQEGDPVEYIINLKRFKLFKPIYKLYFKKVDKVQVISNYLKNWAIELGINKNKIIVVPNGVRGFWVEEKDFNKVFKEVPPKNKRDYIKKYTLSLSENAQREIDEIDKINNLQKNDKLVLTVSRLVEKNGIEYLIRSMQYLDDSIKLRIVGDGKLRYKLERLTKDLKLGNRIVFFGNLPYKNLWKYYIHANVFVRPSLSEGLGNVFLEAMSIDLKTMTIGIPVIATPVGGIPDFLKDGETGWFCQVKNPQSIAEKIKYILDDKNKEEVEKVVVNARKMVEEKYTWDKIAGQMKKIFNNITI